MPPMKPKEKAPKAGGGKKGGKEKSTVLIDGLPITTMSREQLENHVIRLRTEIDKEREERNYFQLERDKLQGFWEITKKQLEAKKIEIREGDRRNDETEERHLRDKKLLNQKMRHLQFDNQNKLTDAKSTNLTLLKTEQQEYEKRQRQFADEKEQLLKQLRNQETTTQEIIQKLRLKHSEEMAKMRILFETQVTEIESKYQDKLKQAEKDLKTKYEMEIQELEERKNQHTENLIRNHDKALTNMKNFYNDITVNNMTLITTLKEQVVQRTDKETRLEKKLEHFTAENGRLNLTIQQSQLQIKDWEKQLKNYNKDKEILTNTRKHLKSSNEEIQNLKWELEVIKQSFMKLQNERDDLHEKFVSAIQDVQQRTSLKNMILEKKYQTLEQLIENKE